MVTKTEVVPDLQDPSARRNLRTGQNLSRSILPRVPALANGLWPTQVCSASPVHPEKARPANRMLPRGELVEKSRDRDG